MKIRVSDSIYLQLISMELVEEFFLSINSLNNNHDIYRTDLQSRYPHLDDLKNKIIDAIENKYLVDNTPDFLIYHNGEIAGMFVFHPLSEDDFIEVGYWLFSEYQQRGILSAVLPVMIKYAQEKFSKSKMIADTETDNIPSIKLLERYGFMKEDEIVRRVGESGRKIDEYRYYYNL